jgi:hypothetical protein
LKKIFTRFAIALLALIAMSVPVSTQSTTTQTTLAAAVTSTGANTFRVASATGFVAGYFAVVDGEMFQIQSVSGTTITVSRGVNGSRAGLHASGAVVFAGPANYFLPADLSPGPCTATAFVALPAVTAFGSVYDCKGTTAGVNRWRLNGFSAPLPGPTQTYTASGAITVMPGLHLLGSGGAIAMTLAAPTSAQDGMVLDISAITAQAHTVTATTIGFNAGSTATDLCTFTAAIGNQISVRASGGNWYIVSARNCTLS